jgi:alpha-N-acetylglucosamine transferase
MMPPGTTEWVGGCGPTDLMRIHAFGLTEYEAVLYFDGDVVVVNDISSLLACAASGNFLMTEGPK